MEIINSIKEKVIGPSEEDKKKQQQQAQQQSNNQLNQTQLQFEEYDPDERPPKFRVCREHYVANRVGKPIKMKSITDTPKLCPCCGNQIENMQLEFMCDIKEMGFLGSGIPMFFEFIKFCMIVSFIVIITTTWWQFTSNPQGEGCDNYESLEDQECPSFVQNYVSTENLRGEVIEEGHSLLHLIASVLMMVYTMRFRNQLEKLQVQIDASHLTPSDFAVKVKGYPRNTTEDEIKDHLTHCLKADRNQKGVELEVTEVVLAYDISQYMQLVKEKQEFLRQQGRLYQQKSKGVQGLDSKINDIEIMITQVEKHIQKVIERSRDKDGGFLFQSCGTAFVSFQKDQYCDFVISNFQKSTIERIFEKIFCPSKKGYQKDGKIYEIQIQRASEPTDVNWENLAISNYVKTKQRVFTILGSGLAIILSFGFIFLFSYVQSVIQESGDTSFAAQGISIGASFFIVALNGLLSIVVRKLTNYEKHSTQTNYQASLAKKLGFAQFVNTALVTLIVNLAFNGNSFMVTGGLISDITWILVVNAIVPPLLNVLNPYHIYNYYLRQKIRDDLVNKRDCHLTQQQANDIFTGPKYDLAKQYASVVKIMLSSAFFFYLIPYAAILSLIALIIFYWQNKIQLLRRNSKPHAIGVQMSEQMVDFYLELIILVHAIGCTIFENAIFDTITGFTILQLILSIVFYIFPIHKLFYNCIKVERPNTVDKYDDVYPFFTTDYGRANPITQQEATQRWFQKQGLILESQKQISESQRGKQNTGIFSNLQRFAQNSLQQGQKLFSNITNYGQNQVQMQQQRMQMMQMARMQQQNQFVRQQMVQQRQQSTQSQQQNNNMLLQQRQQMLGRMMNMQVQNPVQYNPQSQYQQQQPIMQSQPQQNTRMSQVQPFNPAQSQQPSQRQSVSQQPQYQYVQPNYAPQVQQPQYPYQQQPQQYPQMQMQVQNPMLQNPMQYNQQQHQQNMYQPNQPMQQQGYPQFQQQQQYQQQQQQ